MTGSCELLCRLVNGMWIGKRGDGKGGREIEQEMGGERWGWTKKQFGRVHSRISWPQFTCWIARLSSSLQFRRICIKISLYAPYHLVERTGKGVEWYLPTGCVRPLACCWPFLINNPLAANFPFSGSFSFSFLFFRNKWHQAFTTKTLKPNMPAEKIYLPKTLLVFKNIRWRAETCARSLADVYGRRLISAATRPPPRQEKHPWEPSRLTAVTRCRAYIYEVVLRDARVRVPVCASVTIDANGYNPLKRI